MHTPIDNIIRQFLKRSGKPHGKVGLALGGGAAKGWAHIGVIHALNEAGIKVDYVAGTSMGAVVGAVFAAGNIETLEDVALQFSWKQTASFFDIVIPRSGLIDGQKVSQFIKENVKCCCIEDLPIPFAAVATDLSTGQQVVIDKGDIIEAVRASVSIPGLFTPVRRGDQYLLDGGLVNPVPVDVVREMGADYVIAVDLNQDIEVSYKQKTPPAKKTKKPKKQTKENMFSALNNKISDISNHSVSYLKFWENSEEKPGLFDIVSSSLNIIQAKIALANQEMHKPDLIIRPMLGHISLMEFGKAEEAIEEGYRTAKEVLKI